MELNKDYTRRATIMAENGVKEQLTAEKNDIAHYSGLTATGLQTLVDERFADPEETQNESPSIAEFIKFMRKYPKFTAHGYIVSHERSDYRVSVEGVTTEKELTKDEILAFVDMFRFADEFEIASRGAHCWYD